MKQRNAFHSVRLLALCAFLPSLASAAVQLPISFSDAANMRTDTINDAQNFPSGEPVYFNDIPFNIPETGNHGWNGNTAAAGGSQVVTLDLNLSISGATEVYTLINSAWGSTDSDPALASIIFTTLEGSSYTYDLIGGQNIRDYSSSSIWFPHSLTSPDAENVFAAGDTVIDMQHIVLPSAFASETLNSITIEDRGDINDQRLLVSGLTVVAAVPENATFSSLLGLIALLGVLRLRARQ